MMRAIVLGLLLVAVVPSARAADDLARKTQAVALIKQALPLQEAGRHEDALKLLDQSWATFAHPKALFYKGRSLMALERWDEALVLYEQIRTSTRDLEAEKLAEVEANLVRCRAERDQREAARAKPLTVIVSPAGETAQDAKAGQSVAVPGPAKEEQAPVLQDGASTRQQTAATRRVWAWVTLGTGFAALTGGLAFLGNYAYQQTTTLGPNQHRAGGTADLAAGASLAAVGVSLGVGSIFLFRSNEEASATAFAAPTLGGGLVGIAGRW